MEIINKNTFIPSLQDRVMIVAELSANHAGKLETALETIRAAKRAGADAIKLQTYTADSLTIDCNKDDFKIEGGTLWDGKTLYQLYQEACTPLAWHDQLFQVAADEGLICFSSPFDRSLVDFLEKFDPPAYKIASFEIQDIPLIEYVASKGRPVILSTGIAEKEDIDLAIEACRKTGNNQLVLLKCTSAYPAPVDEANLKTISYLKKKYQVPVGLSDHTLGTELPMLAVACGARMIEKHFILDKSVGGPDASFSLDEKEFGEMVAKIRLAERAMGEANLKLTDKIKANRHFGRSLYVVKDMQEGEIFTLENVRSIRPGKGLHPKHLPNIFGKKASGIIEKGTPLSWQLVQ